MDIAAIGRNQLRDALAGKMSSCDVSEWLDDEGKPVKIYWRPLTGVQQRQIEEASTTVDRNCMTVKVRALNEAGDQVFEKVPLVSLNRDYDYSVLRAIAYLMVTEIGQDADERQDEIEKE